MFLADVDQQKLNRAVDRLGLHYHHLRSIAKDRGDLLWRITPKMHYCLHFSRHCQLLNSRYVQVYAEETLVGKILTIWSGSSNGPYGKTIQHTVLIKYLVLLSIVLEI